MFFLCFDRDAPCFCLTVFSVLANEETFFAAPPPPDAQPVLLRFPLRTVDVRWVRIKICSTFKNEGVTTNLFGSQILPFSC